MKTKITEKDFEFKIISKSKPNNINDINDFDFSKKKQSFIMEHGSLDLIITVLAFILFYLIYSNFNFNFNFLNFEHLFTFRNYL